MGFECETMLLRAAASCADRTTVAFRVRISVAPRDAGATTARTGSRVCLRSIRARVFARVRASPRLASATS